MKRQTDDFQSLETPEKKNLKTYNMGKKKKSPGTNDRKGRFRGMVRGKGF